MRRLELPVLVLALGLIFSGLLAGCLASGPSSQKSIVDSPTPDSINTRYVALVHDYWSQYVTARGNGGTVCYDSRHIDPPMCLQAAVAILAVHEKFLSDLDTTPPPPKFAADDQAFRSQLPKAIADVKAMISAAESNDKTAVLQTTTAYVNDMIPIVTSALDDVDPKVIHD